MKKSTLIIAYITVLLGILTALHVSLYLYQANGGNPNWMPIYLIDIILVPYLVYMLHLNFKA
jgi:hypothetical protein